MRAMISRVVTPALRGLPAMRSTSSLLLAATIVCSLISSGCAKSPMTKDPIRVDPEAVSRESGGTDEIIEASQKIVEGLSNCGRLEADKRYRIQLAHIVNTTGLRDYDEEIFYNHLLGQMIEASGDRFSFLDRQAVLNERREQVQGTVESQGVGKLKGADLVLTLEIRGLRGGQTRTVQYTAKLIDLAGEVMCLPRPVEIKKRD